MKVDVIRLITARAARVIPIAAMVVAACDLDSTAPSRDTQAPPRVAAVVEIRFERIGSPDMRTSALVAGDIATLDALRRARARAEARGETFAAALEVPSNQDGSGDATIQLEASLVNSFAYGDSVRYLSASYLVRNAQRTDSAAFDTPRENLTFVAVGTDSTIAGTPVRTLLLAGDVPADPALALELLPTGIAEVDQVSGAVVSTFPGVLQVMTEDEIAGLDLPDAVTNIFPYGFITRRAGVATDRRLEPSPDPGEFQGVVDFAFRIPLQDDPGDDPETITVMFLALDDSETRFTQSIEEQNSAGRSALRLQADALSATTVTLLPGGTVPGQAGTRIVCSARTAGTAASPAAFLTNVDWAFESLEPDPYSADGSGSFIPASSSFQATFSANAEGGGPQNFTVRGLQSGPAFTGESYTGNGSPTITTPAGSFFPGEEVEVVLTTGLSCPEPWTARLRVAAAPASGDFGTATLFPKGEVAPSAAIADFDADGDLDVVATAFNAGEVSVLLGDGNGNLGPAQTFPAGPSPFGVATGDFDGDGSLDIAATNLVAAGTVSILLGDGNGDFTLVPVKPAAGNSPAAIAVGDLNGDGLLDLAVANLGSADVSVLLGDGIGRFVDAGRFAVGDGPGSIAIGDLNRDGILDLAVLNQNGGSGSVLLGNGDGTFQGQQTFAVTDILPTSIAIGDLNNDGIPDLAVANQGMGNLSGNLSVLHGNGDGTFVEQGPFNVGNRPVGVAIGDLNGDGILDLAVTLDGAPSSGGLVAVLLGSAGGTYTASGPFPLPTTRTRTVAIGDLNGDDVLDLVAVDRWVTPGVSVLLGQQ